MSQPETKEEVYPGIDRFIMSTQTHIYVQIYNNSPRAEFGKQGSEWALQKSKARLRGTRTSPPSQCVAEG